MPFAYEDFKEALLVPAHLASNFPAFRLTAVVPENFRALLEKDHFSEVIPLKPRDADFFQLPNKGLKNSLSKKGFDLAIDLNFKANLFSSILCAASGARVRVGFDGQEWGQFFNYLILPREASDSKSKFRALLHYLCFA